jgi:hypothetical protein
MPCVFYAGIFWACNFVTTIMDDLCKLTELVEGGSGVVDKKKEERNKLRVGEVMYT